MEAWQIALIVVGSILLLVFILSALLFSYAGKQTVGMLKRCDHGFKGMPISVDFYDKGPVKKKAEEGIAFMDQIGHEDLYIKSYDNLKLHAYYFKNPNQKDNRILLGMHGFKSGPRHEYAPYIKEYFDLGFSLICPDERAHYLSEGEYIMMGSKERYDALSWCNYIVDTFGSDVKILMQGISMGGATVCLASNLDLPKNVYGIISDCAYSSFKDQIAYTMKHSFKMNEFPIMRVISAHTKRIGLDLYGESPVDAVKESRVPILFMQGEIDEMVPAFMAKELYNACGSRRRLYIAAGANHAESEASNPELYFKIIQEFFSELFSKENC